MLCLSLAFAQDPTPPAEGTPTEAPAPEEAPPRNEDDIFGASSEPGPEEGETPGEDPGLPSELGRPQLSDMDLSDRLGAANSFEIGGQAFLRANAYIAETPSLEEVRMDSPSFVDLFTDARPNDQMRFYGRARTYHDITVQAGDTTAFGTEAEPTRVVLDQLWMNVNISRRVYITVGRQRIRWGVGRLWNPTDFLAPSTLDGLAAGVFDERVGVGLLKVHIPLEKTGTNIYLIADYEGADTPDQVGGALRIEQIVGMGEIALTGNVHKDHPVKLGAQANFPIWRFDLKGEAAFTNGVSTPFWEGELDIDSLSFPTEYSREEDWIFQGVLSAETAIQYNDEDVVYLGAEYFHNDAGYQDESLYPWLLVQGQYTPFYLGRQYVAAYASLAGPGQLDEHRFTITGITNLGDESWVGRADWFATVQSELTINSFVQVHGGTEGGEFNFALDVEPIPGLLEDGFVIERPVVDVGIGLRMGF